ncbi:MAG: hypothetical protein ACRCT1_12300 [Microcoleaceae cyanobacterium]
MKLAILGLEKNKNITSFIYSFIGEKIMLIQDLNHVEMISEETHLEGGAFSSSGAGAFSTGLITGNQSSASTNAQSGYNYYWYGYSQSTSGQASASGFAVFGAVQTTAGSLSVA